MIDISEKKVIKRQAIASGRIVLKPETIQAIQAGTIKKGNVLEVARLAAILAVKNTPQLIPLCHQIPIEGVEVGWDIGSDQIKVEVAVVVQARTGVEMEALAGVSAALLTVWDMVKYLEKDQKGQYQETRIEGVRVVKKIKQV
ncbi:MAG TPA: cyclic pyranopterin monophosphate synthase MoaC [Candidatus Wirthbacteria bacterium]|nr:cyclic pyranopterin monophosphate synthase MoaC [Candidatus Wirthbacteria bacterium]